METPHDNSNGIPVVVSGIPTVKDENGIVSPFPYLNPDSEEWKGDDEQDDFDEGGGIGVRPIDPDEPDNDGGDEEEFEDNDEDDGTDTGFGIGIGLLSFSIFPPLLPA